MSKHVFYVTAIIFLAIAVEWKLDASIYKKDAQLLLMNQNFGNPNIHKMLTDSCYYDCLKYRKKYGKEGTE